MLNGDTIIEVPIIIRPSLKRACCDNEPWRAAIFSQMLYNIAWAKQDHKRDNWSNNYDYILNQLDNSFCKTKLIKEIKALVNDGLLHQEKVPGVSQMKQYKFGPDQAAIFKRMCNEADVCIHCFNFGPAVLDLLKITGVITEKNPCRKRKDEEVVSQEANSKSTQAPSKNTLTDSKSTPSLNKGRDKGKDKGKDKEREEGSQQPRLFESVSTDLTVPSLPSQENESSEETPAPTTVPAQPSDEIMWSAEKALAWSEYLVGKKYRNQDSELRACLKVIKEFKIDEKMYVRAFVDVNKWWKEKKGLLHPTDMVGRSWNTRQVRILEVVENLEYQDERNATSTPTPPRSTDANKTNASTGQRPDDYEITEIQLRQQETTRKRIEVLRAQKATTLAASEGVLA